MKKFNYLLLGLAGLTLASCSQEDVVAPGSGDGNVAITVKLPADLGTRALGDGISANTLVYAVYTVADEASSPQFSFQGEASFNNSLETTLNLNLISGKSYQFAFFACAPSALTNGETESVYTFTPTGDTPTISVNYDKMLGSVNNVNNADAYDCFYKMTETYEAGNEQSPYEVMLTRPVAQINWGTSELGANNEIDVTFGDKGQYIQTDLEVEGQVYTQFDLFNGDVVDGSQIKQPLAIFSTSQAPIPTGTAFPVDPNTYDYVSCQYLLAPKDGSTCNLTLNINNKLNNQNLDQNGEQNLGIDVLNAPIQANYRTNIYGNLLSTNATFQITKDKIFAGSHEIDELPTFTIDAEDLNNFSITESGIYKLSGDLDGVYKINMNNAATRASYSGLDVIVDGSGLKAKEGKKFNLMFLDDGMFPHAPADILSNNPRLGNYTFQNFTEGTINVKTGNTTVNVNNNTLDCLIVAGGNLTLNITGNVIDNGGESYLRWDNGYSKYSVYLYTVDYDLTFDNNQVTNSIGAPFCNYGWANSGNSGEWRAEDMLNLSKYVSFSGNTITVSEYEANEASWTAAIAIQANGTFYTTAGTEDTLSPAAVALMDQINNSNNTFVVGGNATGLWKFKFTSLEDGYPLRLQKMAKSE